MPNVSTQETIYALSSGSLPAGVAVIRISGTQAGEILRQLIKGRFPVSRESALKKIYDPRDNSVIDHALVLWFEGPKSFTGEDTVEIHCHGGRAVVAALLDVLGQFPNSRPAEQGEFTRRAFHNNKLDLTEVEGLADLIDAETEAQRRQAQRQMQGALGELYESWRKALIHSRAMIEAELDFSDEDDVPDSVAEQVWQELDIIKQQIDSHLKDSRRGERLRSGLQVVLLGSPNAGKSSLMNHLANRDVAIVTPEAGTTRDVLEVHLDLGGYPVTLLDTAGLREQAGIVEQEGIRRALSHAEQADLILWTQAPQSAEGVEHELMTAFSGELWVLQTKVDLQKSYSNPPQAIAENSVRTLQCSVKAEGGMDRLLCELTEFAEKNMGLNEAPVITRERHRHYLNGCLENLRRAISMDGYPIELRSEELRAAANQLGRITGRVDVEDLLDVIFGDFCIGK
ncbi:tRNA uridine-5-carboxymethylaminomethyl(34) synthesis GTPase MnmE [Polycladidibacter stylochi]|uniref:tRNA uridine-5-carboxymethylaminomethyl(34) synthesis GTPase MnmE n=1 Tax=Polycladidibacter stylochi TaxID=1807766 RepID=UPI00082FD245|nr:tRNA uridine-5-carboxymethylaminomethyl(34) synthesis GTPase MnmE [Pseudovibrio stylochi]